MIDRIQETALLRTSAAIGRYFYMDPVIVASSDSYDYAFRQAAYLYMSEVEKEAAAKQKAEQEAVAKKR